MSDSKITICLCSSRSIIDRDMVSGISDRLRKEGYTVVFEPDLCEKVISSGKDMEKIASTVVMACYPRAVSALFGSIGLCPNRIVDIRNGSEKDISESFGLTESIDVSYTPDVLEKTDNDEISDIPENTKDLLNVLPTKVGFDAWFPVIDRERCNNCGKCHDFCLFGVYAKEERTIVVKKPQNCKNNCPACARVCPQKAIIFPKYEKSPINGGLADEEFALSIDTKALYSDALRTKLTERRRAGMSLLKNK